MEKIEIKDQKPYNAKGGRPPKKVKRQNQLMVRLTETERFLIEEKAKDAGDETKRLVQVGCHESKSFGQAKT